MTPVVKLKPAVTPLSIVRLAVLGDILKNFGATDEQIRLAQQGYAERLFDRVIIDGLDATGYIQDQVTLRFDALNGDTAVAVDTSSGRTMVEAVSIKLARGLAYSVECMRRKGLAVRFTYAWTSSAWNNPATRQDITERFNLVDTPLPDFAPGYGPREIFRITPGLDKGTHYAHAVARKLG